jgi:hypothetical protein
MNYRAMFAVFCGLAVLPLSAQTPLACTAKLVPLKPVGLYCENAVAVCITDTTGVNGEWVWGCPTSSTNAQVPPGGGVAILPPIQYPHIDTPSEIMLKAEQIRQMRQQRELMRQQTEALRQSNAANQTPTYVPTELPRFPLAEAYATMPDPTGDAKTDERNWKKWVKQHKAVRTILPPWSPDAYAKVRVLAFDQVSNTTFYTGTHN